MSLAKAPGDKTVCNALGEATALKSSASGMDSKLRASLHGLRGVIGVMQRRPEIKALWDVEAGE